MSLQPNDRELRVARASRVLVAASRRDELPETSSSDRTPVPKRTLSKVRSGETPEPTRGTRVLPGTLLFLLIFLSVPLHAQLTVTNLQTSPKPASTAPISNT